MDQIFLNKKVLVVDDEEKNIQLIGSILKKHEKKVKIFVASDGKEAIERCYSFMPDIILMDIQMPILDGLETTKILRSQSQYDSMKIIALTANAIKGVKQKYTSIGMDGYLSKPFKPEDLYRAIMSSR